MYLAHLRQLAQKIEADKVIFLLTNFLKTFIIHATKTILTQKDKNEIFLMHVAMLIA